MIINMIDICLLAIKNTVDNTGVFTVKRDCPGTKNLNFKNLLLIF